MTVRRAGISNQQLAALAARHKQDIEREYCRRRFVHFVKRAWYILEPATYFHYDYYIDAIAEHLEALFRGEIRELVINIPPRLAKSLLAAVFFPAWAWTIQPELRFLYSSYAEFLSRRDSRKTRTLIRSRWYQGLWGDVFNLVEDQNQVLRFDNSRHGYRIATSVGGVGTGEGGDVVCVDDPISIMQAFSAARLEEVVRWWDEQMATRLNDPKTGRRLIIMQRSHTNDLTGHVLKQGNYVHLMLPMEYEPDRCCHTEVRPTSREPFEGEDEQGSYRWDLRETEGESLSPNRFGPEEIAKLKQRLQSSHAVDSQLQQRPSPRGGGLVKMSWFRSYRTAPAPDTLDAVVHSWDTANKGGQTNAYTVGGIWGITGSAYYLLAVIRERLDIPQVQKLIQDVGQHGHGWPQPTAILIENKASGIGIIQHLHQTTTLPVIPVEPEKDKVTRMDTETPALEAGNVFLPEEAPWLTEFQSEVRAFPNYAYQDQVDMLSQFLRWMRLGQTMTEDDWEIY